MDTANLPPLPEQWQEKLRELRDTTMADDDHSLGYRDAAQDCINALTDLAALAQLAAPLPDVAEVMRLVRAARVAFARGQDMPRPEVWADSDAALNALEAAVTRLAARAQPDEHGDNTELRIMAVAHMAAGGDARLQLRLQNSIRAAIAAEKEKPSC